MPPQALPDDAQRAFAEMLCGELMGKGVKKGYTHRWIVNHLQDAHQQLVPRSIINLLSFSAQRALKQGPKGLQSANIRPL